MNSAGWCTGLPASRLASLAWCGATSQRYGSRSKTWAPLPIARRLRVSSLSACFQQVRPLCGEGPLEPVFWPWLRCISSLPWRGSPRIVGYPGIYGTWNGFFEQVSLVAAGIVGYASLAPPTSAWTTRTVQVGCLLYGICAVSFGAGHFTAIAETAGMTPKWLPPGQLFWAWATGAFHLLAGIAIVTGVQAALASRLLTAMMLGFGALVWAPALFAKPGDHTTWAGNAITLALAGAAWVIADSISARRKQIRNDPGGRSADAAG